MWQSKFYIITIIFQVYVTIFGKAENVYDLQRGNSAFPNVPQEELYTWEHGSARMLLARFI